MTTVHSWHVAPDELQAYVADAAPTLSAASIEAHLLRCADCRTALATVRGSVEPTTDAQLRSERMWACVADRVDVPRRPMRSASRTLHVSLASPPLLAATVGVATTLLVAVGVVSVASPHWTLPVLLAIAPLAPVVAAIVAFQPGSDPAGQLAEATPLAGARLPLLRAVLATLLSLLSGIAASVFSAMPFDLVAVWLLPGAAFAAIILASATVLNPTRVAAPLMIAWAALVFDWTRGHRTVPSAEALRNLMTNQRASGWLLLGATFTAIVICYRRRGTTPAWRLG